MTATVSGRTLLSHRPDAKTFVLWRVGDKSGTHYHWQGETRRHTTMSDAYDAIGLPPEQAPNVQVEGPAESGTPQTKKEN